MPITTPQSQRVTYRRPDEESWLGLRSLLEHATEDGESLAPAGTHGNIVQMLTQNPVLGPEAIGWLAHRMETGATAVRLKCLMLVHHLSLTADPIFCALIKSEQCVLAVRANLIYMAEDPVRGALPAKLVRRWAQDVLGTVVDTVLSSQDSVELEEREIILHRDRTVGLGLCVESTMVGEAIITRLPLRPDGSEGTAEQAGLAVSETVILLTPPPHPY